MTSRKEDQWLFEFSFYHPQIVFNCRPNLWISSFTTFLSLLYLLYFLCSYWTCWILLIPIIPAELLFNFFLFSSNSSNCNFNYISSIINLVFNLLASLTDSWTDGLSKNFSYAFSPFEFPTSVHCLSSWFKLSSIIHLSSRIYFKSLWYTSLGWLLNNSSYFPSFHSTLWTFATSIFYIKLLTVSVS